MIIRKDLEQGDPQWLSFREGKITGTKLGKMFAKSRKQEELFNTEKPMQMLYEIIAERLATTLTEAEEDFSSTMERGLRLEVEATELAVKQLGLRNVAIDGVWIDDKNNNYLCSPDAYEDVDKPSWAMEVKCLSSANHVKAIIENEWPSEYKYQVLNYFLVNPNLQTLYFVMYDRRFINEALRLKIFTIKRGTLASEIERMRVVRESALATIESMVEQLSYINYTGD